MELRREDRAFVASEARRDGDVGAQRLGAGRRAVAAMELPAPDEAAGVEEHQVPIATK